MSPEPRLRNFTDWLWFLFCGFSMGAADLVPGVSGGTMAFIMGFYEHLINNVKSINIHVLKALCRGRIKDVEECISLKFLFALLLGMITAFALLSHTLFYLLNHELYRVYLFSAFMGLIAASALFCLRRIQQWQLLYCVPMFLGAVAAFLLTTADYMPQSGMVMQLYDVKIAPPLLEGRVATNYDSQTGMLLNVDRNTLSAMLAKGYIQKGTLVYEASSHKSVVVDEVIKEMTHSIINGWIILCGAIGISAMLLPGISGSYLLTILGAYPLVIEALADLTVGISAMTIDVDAALLLANLGVGIVIGGALFSRIISWLFHHYHDLTIAMLVGFMLGALGAVWPFWSYRYLLLPLKLDKGVRLEVISPILPDPASSVTWIAIAVGIAAFLAILAIEVIAAQKGNQVLK